MSVPILSLQTIHNSFSSICQYSKLQENKMLGAICFVDDSAAKANFDIPSIQLEAPVLDGEDTSCELWLIQPASLVGNVIANGNIGNITYRFDDDFLFGVISLPESTLSQNETDISLLASITESAYREIFSLMEANNYPHVYRFWNYMADINGVSQDLERYRQFNVGRKNAFLACSDITDNHLPAACALGMAVGTLSIAFLLGRQAPIAIENPRQISAYEYPDRYGPQTPSFSRATLLNAKQSAFLFISGTASIVGHQTLHLTDVLAQTKETLTNLEAVIAETNRIYGEKRFELQHFFLRVYIRHVADLSLIKNEIQRHLGNTIKAVYIQADICRKELLLEIEATS